MNEDAVFYTLISITMIITIILWVNHIKKIKQKEFERQRRVAMHLSSVQMPKEEMLPKQLQKQSLQKANQLQQFHVEQFGCNLPIKPASGVIEVKSSADRNVTYEVDLEQQTCTCKNFAKRRSHPKNHVARWCKHLLKSLNKAGAFSTLEGLQSEVVRFNYTQCDQMYLIKHKELPEMILTLTHDWLSEGWININARKKRTGEKVSQASGDFQNYGWNLYQERWSYGEGPPGASLIRPLLKTVDASEIESLLEEMCGNSQARVKS